MRSQIVDKQDVLLVGFFAWISLVYAKTVVASLTHVSVEAESAFFFFVFTHNVLNQLSTNGCFRQLLWEYWVGILIGLRLNRGYALRVFVATSFTVKVSMVCKQMLLALLTLAVIGYALRTTVQLLPWFEAQRARTFFAQETFSTVMREVFLYLAAAWIALGFLEYIRRYVFVKFVMSPMNISIGDTINDGYWSMSKKERRRLFLEADFANISPEGLGVVVRAVREDVNKFLATITREPPVMVASFAMFCLVATMAPALAFPILLGLVIKTVVHLWVTRWIYHASEREFVARSQVEQVESEAFVRRSARAKYRKLLVSYAHAFTTLELVQSAGQNLLKELVERLLSLMITGYIVWNYLYSGEFEPATTLAMIGFAAMSDDFGRGLLSLLDDFARFEPAIRRATKIAGLHRGLAKEFAKRWTAANLTPYSIVWTRWVYSSPTFVYVTTQLAGLRTRFFLTFSLNTGIVYPL